MKRITRSIPKLFANKTQPRSVFGTQWNKVAPAQPRTMFQQPMVRFASTEPQQMFCFQCEQTKDTKGCTTLGVCGKTPQVAGLQDLLVENLKHLCVYLHLARTAGVSNSVLSTYNDFVLRAMYSTLTNVNFDDQRFIDYLDECEKLTAGAKQICGHFYSQLQLVFPKDLDIKSDLTKREVNSLYDKAKQVGVQERMKVYGTDTASLQELLTYGLKGLAAYTKEAALLGQTNDAVFDFMNMAMAFLSGVRNVTQYDINNPNDVLTVALKCGEVNITTMSLLDKGGNDNFGHPTPTQVLTTPVPGKCILVSGHDLGDLNAILKQTEGTGINVYTHGELLPAHGYPALKKYKHLVGNYGGAWQLQKMEFSKFPGSIVVTTNCIIEPRKQYSDRIFTTGQVGYTGVKHIKNRDFSELIAKAKECEGFPQSVENEPKKYVTTGFGHHAVLGIADIIINAVKRGDIKNFFLIGGCDGSEGERNYYKELATSLPKDNVILTLGCAKYRFNKLDHGTISTINPRDQKPIDLPRLIDMGQCNDAFSAVKVASALADAFGTKDLNALPLRFAISWFEQKAVVIFLTLLHLGIKNIRIGPNLPAFVPPSTLKMLVETFQLHPISASNTQGDMAAMLKGQ